MNQKKWFYLAVTLLLVIGGFVTFTILAGGFGFDVLFVGIIIILFLIYTIPQILSSRNDNVIDDEFKTQSLRLAASRSFYISIYMWLALLWFDELFENGSFQIAFGIGLMTILFIINAIIIRHTGIKH